MNDRSIAYFSMEMALRPDMPTYSGSLGVLAGDTIRSAADLKLPMVAVSMPTCRRIPNGTALSLIISMAAIFTPGCARKSFWASAACGCSARSAITT